MSSEASRIEWFFKWQLLEKLRRRLHPTVVQSDTSAYWDDQKLKAVDLSWAALDPATSVFEKLRSHTEQVNTQDDIVRATQHAPEDTRAWLRAVIVQRYPQQVVAASWSHLTVRAHPEAVDDIDFYGNASRPRIRQSDLITLDMSEPVQWNRTTCEQIVDECSNAAETLSRLSEIIATSR